MTLASECSRVSMRDVTSIGEENIWSSSYTPFLRFLLRDPSSDDESESLPSCWFDFFCRFPLSFGGVTKVFPKVSSTLEEKGRFSLRGLSPT